MVIQVKNNGSQNIKTGKNVSSTATTFFDSGPQDALESVDIFSPSDATAPVGGQAGGGGANAGGAGGGGAGGAGGSITDSLLSASGIVSNSESVIPDTLRTVADMASSNLWEALLCGPPTLADESSRSRLSRMRNMAAWLRELGCAAEDIAELVTFEGGGLSLDTDEIASRLSGGLEQTFRQMNDLAKDRIVSDLASRTGGAEDAIRFVIDNEAESVRSADFSSAEDMVNLLSGLSDGTTAELLDIGAESAVIGEVLDSAIKMGVPRITDRVIDQFNDDEQKRRNILRRVRQSAISSNLHLVRRAIEIEGAESVLARVPDLVVLITRHYTLRGAGADQFPERRQELLDTLEQVDPNWYRTKRAGVWVDDLSAFTAASRDATTLLRDSQDHRVSMMIAESYREQSIFQSARLYNDQVILSGF